MEFRYEANQSPASESRRAEILANPGFGQYFSDHMVTIDWTADLPGQEAAFQAGEYLKMVGEWSDARVEPYGPLSMSPAAAVLHYAQEIFEGLKAYRHDDGSIWTFRPHRNAARMNRSAHRMAMPQLPEEVFVKAIEELVTRDHAWVPTARDSRCICARSRSPPKNSSASDRHATLASTSLPHLPVTTSEANSSPSASGSRATSLAPGKAAPALPNSVGTTQHLWQHSSKEPLAATTR